jgi:hypothetical protein
MIKPAPQSSERVDPAGKLAVTLINGETVSDGL